jgi:hypothetical protein
MHEAQATGTYIKNEKAQLLFIHQKKWFVNTIKNLSTVFRLLIHRAIFRKSNVRIFGACVAVVK